MIYTSKRRSFRDKKREFQKWSKPFMFLVILIFSYFVLSLIFLVPVKVESDSMAPALKKGARIVCSPAVFGKTFSGARILPAFYTPKRGDLILFRPPYYVENHKVINAVNPYIRFITFQQLFFSSYKRQSWENPYLLKRIIGIPGDTVKISEFVAYVKTEENTYFLSEFEMSRFPYDLTVEELPKNWEPDDPFSSEQEELILGPDQYFVLGDNRGASNDSRYWGVVSRREIIAKVLFQYWPLNEFGRP